MPIFLRHNKSIILIAGFALLFKDRILYGGAALGQTGVAGNNFSGRS